MLPQRASGPGGFHGQRNRFNEAQRYYHHPRYSNGFFFYGGTGLTIGFNYGYWSFGLSYCPSPYCYSSPFAYYGFPYVYAPRVEVVEVPVYTYTTVPAYSYDNGYYLSPGSYTGLDSAISDIKNAWIGGREDLILRHIDTNTQIAVYLNNDYSYSLPGSDYSAMVQDAIGHIQTTSFTVNNVEQRSDGAYTILATHEFYDVNKNFKSVNVSYTLANVSGRWVIVAAGSSENT
jgi:hypothetical protein